MNCPSLFFAAYLAILLALPSQLPDPKELPVNKGSIVGQNTYHNPALSMTINLPGEWHLFDRRVDMSTESKQKDKEMLEHARATCKGPLCETVIDVALRSPSAPPQVYAIYLTAFRLTTEYQNRQRYPLRGLAENLTLESLVNEWAADGPLTEIQLGGKPAYRLNVHFERVATVKGFMYVADSNGQVFMLLGVALSEPEKLQSAIEHMSFSEAKP